MMIIVMKIIIVLMRIMKTYVQNKTNNDNGISINHSSESEIITMDTFPIRKLRWHRCLCWLVDIMITLQSHVMTIQRKHLHKQSLQSLISYHLQSSFLNWRQLLCRGAISRFQCDQIWRLHGGLSIPTDIIWKRVWNVQLLLLCNICKICRLITTWRHLL